MMTKSDKLIEKTENNRKTLENRGKFRGVVPIQFYYHNGGMVGNLEGQKCTSWG